MLDEIYQETGDNMGKSITSLENEFKRIRTGRASVSILDGIRVDYYGTATPLNQMASLSVPESRLISIQPWDVSVIKEIEKAILKSDLGLTPSSDGKIIRIAIPPLTEERRKELVKVINKMSEDHKVAVRNLRRDANDMIKELKKEGEISEDEAFKAQDQGRDANDMIKELKKEGEISEDEAFKAQDQVQKITDEHIELIDEINNKKEKEILEF
jgi:ribosome recycling factor